MNTHFTSSGYTTIKTPSGQYTFKGVSVPDLCAHIESLQKEIARRERMITALESVWSGESKLDPAALY